MHKTVALIVGYDHCPEKDSTILVVGKKTAGTDVEIINAFEGKDAEELYCKLIKKETDV